MRIFGVRLATHPAMALEMLVAETARLRPTAADPYSAFEHALDLVDRHHPDGGRAEMKRALPLEVLSMLNPRADCLARQQHTLTVRLRTLPPEHANMDPPASPAYELSLPEQYKHAALPHVHGRHGQFFAPLAGTLPPRAAFGQPIIHYAVVLDGERVLASGYWDTSAAAAAGAWRRPLPFEVTRALATDAQARFAAANGLPMATIELRGHYDPLVRGAHISQCVLMIEIVSSDAPAPPFADHNDPDHDDDHDQDDRDFEAPPLVQLGSAAQTVFAAAYLLHLQERYPGRSLQQTLDDETLLDRMLAERNEYEVRDGLRTLIRRHAGQPRLPTLNELLHHTSGLPPSFQMSVDDLNTLVGAKPNPMFEHASPLAAFGYLLATRCRIVFPLGTARLESPLGYAVLGATLTVPLHAIVGSLVRELGLGQPAQHHQCSGDLYAPYSGVALSSPAINVFMRSRPTMARLFAHRVPVLAMEAAGLPGAAYGMGNLYGTTLGARDSHDDAAGPKLPAALLVGHSRTAPAVMALAFPALRRALVWRSADVGPVAPIAVIEQMQTMATALLGSLSRTQLAQDAVGRPGAFAFEWTALTPLHRELVELTRRDLQHAVAARTTTGRMLATLRRAAFVPLLELPAAAARHELRFDLAGDRPVLHAGQRRYLLVARAGHEGAPATLIAVDPTNLTACLPVRPVAYRSAAMLNAPDSELTVEFGGRVYGSPRLARTVQAMLVRLRCADAADVAAVPLLSEEAIEQDERRARRARKYGGGGHDRVRPSVEEIDADIVSASIANRYAVADETASASGYGNTNDWPDLSACPGAHAFAQAYYVSDDQ
jgi:hypothetical protein